MTLWWLPSHERTWCTQPLRTCTNSPSRCKLETGPSMLNTIRVRSVDRSSRDQTAPCCVPTRKCMLPSATKQTARMLPEANVYLATVSNLGRVST